MIRRLTEVADRKSACAKLDFVIVPNIGRTRILVLVAVLKRCRNHGYLSCCTRLRITGIVL